MPYIFVNQPVLSPHEDKHTIPLTLANSIALALSMSVMPLLPQLTNLRVPWDYIDIIRHNLP